MKDKGHFVFSLTKSVLRIVGCLHLLLAKDLITFAIIFISAECLGIFEEIFDKRK